MIYCEDILEFWFGDSVECMDSFDERRHTWFSVSDEFDNEIRERFEQDIEYAAQQSLECNLDNPRELLAFIILLDQFPRNVYRGTPKAFAYDTHALKLTRKLIDEGIDSVFPYVERQFVYMPLQHAEDKDIQQLSVKMFESLKQAADNDVLKQSGQESLWYAELHKEIIDDFGRFPHRNEILGRDSTKAELDYLASGAESFGQTKK